MQNCIRLESRQRVGGIFTSNLGPLDLDARGERLTAGMAHVIDNKKARAFGGKPGNRMQTDEAGAAGDNDAAGERARQELSRELKC